MSYVYPGGSGVCGGEGLPGAGEALGPDRRTAQWSRLRIMLIIARMDQSRKSLS